MTKLRLLNLAIATGVVAFIVLRAHPHELWSALSETNYRLALLAIVPNLPICLLASLRSSLLFRRLGHRVPAGVLVPATVLGFVAGGLTPASAGELLRAKALRSSANVDVDQSIAVVVYERVLALYLLALTTALIAALSTLPLAWSPLLLAVALGLVLLPWLVALKVGSFASLAERMTGAGMLPRVARNAFAMAEKLRVLLREPFLLLQWSSLTIAMFALIALQYWLLARAIAGGIEFSEAWLALGVSTIAAVLTLLPFGLGVLDGSLAAMLVRGGLTLEQASLAAIAVRATVTLPLVLAAFACYLYLQRTAPSEQTVATPE